MTLLFAITTMLTANSAPQAIPAKELAPAIIYAAARHDVDPHLLTRILLVESKGVPSAYNKRTQDFGLMQINHKTAKAYGITPWCLKNWQCNLDKAALILSDMPGRRDCEFNVGTRRIVGRLEEICLNYERKLSSL